MAKWYDEQYLKEQYNEGNRYVIRGRSVYQINWSNAQNKIVLQKLYTKPLGGVPLANPGRYHTLNGVYVNKIVGFDLVKE